MSHYTSSDYEKFGVRACVVEGEIGAYYRVLPRAPGRADGAHSQAPSVPDARAGSRRCADAQASRLHGADQILGARAGSANQSDGGSVNDELKVIAWECRPKPEGWNGLPPKEHIAAMLDAVYTENPYWEPHRALVYKDDAERLLAERDARIAELERERDEAMRDSQRYRWIADEQPDIDWISDPDNQIVVWAVSGHGYRGRTLGDAIDSAMKGGVVPSPLRGES